MCVRAGIWEGFQEEVTQSEFQRDTWLDQEARGGHSQQREALVRTFVGEVWGTFGGREVSHVVMQRGGNTKLEVILGWGVLGAKQRRVPWAQRPPGDDKGIPGLPWALARPPPPACTRVTPGGPPAGEAMRMSGFEGEVDGVRETPGSSFSAAARYSLRLPERANGGDTKGAGSCVGGEVWALVELLNSCSRQQACEGEPRSLQPVGGHAGAWPGGWESGCTCPCRVLRAPEPETHGVGAGQGCWVLNPGRGPHL